MFCDRVSDARFYLARDVLRLTACTTEGTHSKSLSARRPGALSVDSSGRVPGKIGQEWTDRAPAARGRGVSVEILGGCCGGRREPLRMHFSAHSDICIYLSTYLSISLPIHTHIQHMHMRTQIRGNVHANGRVFAGSLRQTTALCSCHAAVIHTHVSDSSIPYAVWQRASGRARGAFLPWSTPCSALVRALNGLPAYIGSFCSKHSTTQTQ